MKTLSSKLPIIYENLFPTVQKIIHSGYNGSNIIVPHVCNNSNIFGGGFTSGIDKYYPIVGENYRLLGKHFLKNNLGYVQYIEADKDKTYGYKLIFANMIAQNGTISKSNYRPLNYGALVKCMMSVNSYIQTSFDKDSPVQIHAPKFGSGLAGGNWFFIEELINDIWPNYSVFIYDLRKTRS